MAMDKIEQHNAGLLGRFSASDGFEYRDGKLTRFGAAWPLPAGFIKRVDYPPGRLSHYNVSDGRGRWKPAKTEAQALQKAHELNEEL
jgi:hypothetical protein